MSGPLNAGAPLNAIFSFLVLKSSPMMQEQGILIGNIDLSVGDLE